MSSLYYSYEVQDGDTLSDIVEKFKKKKLPKTQNLIINDSLTWQAVWSDPANKETRYICYKGNMSKKGKNDTDGWVYPGEFVCLPYEAHVFYPKTDGTPGTVHVPTIRRFKAVPIMFVPGIMGTRLRNGDTKIWDPDSPLKVMVPLATKNEAWKQQNLGVSKVPTVDLITDNNNKYNDEQIRKGFSTVAKNFYGDFLLRLDDELSKVNERNIYYPVYVCGYDWRRDVFDTANEYLREKYNEIVKYEQFDEMIIITHSMGGIITREFLRQNPDIASKVKGVIHGVQPASGATIFYCYFKCGASHFRDEGISGSVLATILGNKKSQFATLCSDLPGAIELAPTNYFNQDGILDGKWLECDESLESKYRLNTTVNKDDVFSCYMDNQGIFGLSDSEIGRTVNFQLRRNIGLARIFHNRLRLWTHPNTYELSSTGVKTKQGVRIRENFVTPENMIHYQKDRSFFNHMNLSKEQKKLRDIFIARIRSAETGSVRAKYHLTDEDKKRLMMGWYKDYWNFQDYRVEIEVLETEDGDGTVPINSQRVLSTNNESKSNIKNDTVEKIEYLSQGVKHSDIYKNEAVIDNVMKIIREIKI